MEYLSQDILLCFVLFYVTNLNSFVRPNILVYIPRDVVACDARGTQVDLITITTGPGYLVTLLPYYLITW